MDAQSVGYFAAFGGITLFNIWKLLRPLHIFRSPRKYNMLKFSFLSVKCHCSSDKADGYISLSIFFLLSFILSVTSLPIH